MPKPSSQPHAPPPDNQRGRPRKRGRHGKRRNPAPPQPARLSLPGTRVVRANALGASLPELIITYTNEGRVISEWLEQHVSPSVHCLGLDTETKPTYTREAAKAKKGPDVLQLAKSDGHCLVIHLSQMETEEPTTTSLLFNILNSRHIAKAGVAIDDDALNLHENKRLDVHCRLELRGIDKKEQDNTNSSNGSEEEERTTNNNNAPKVPQNLKGLSQHYVPNLKLPKHKKLQMSNWELPLSDAQIEYAAADAFAAAIVVDTVVASNKSTHTNASLMEQTLHNEVDIRSLRSHREAQRKERKIAAEKRRREQETKKTATTNAETSNATSNNNNNDNQEEPTQSSSPGQKQKKKKKNKNKPRWRDVGRVSLSQQGEGDPNDDSNKRKRQGGNDDGVHPLDKALRSRR